MNKSYKELVLDESILDLDTWLLPSAIDEVIQAIINYENRFEENKG